MLIRRLGPRDAARAVEAIRAFKGTARSTEALAGLLGNASHFLLVAEVHGEVAGILLAHRLERPDREASQMFVYEVAVAVAPHRRREGIATALIEEIKALARREGMFEAFVLTTRENERARGLYERTGGIVEDDAAILFVYPFDAEAPGTLRSALKQAGLA